MHLHTCTLHSLAFLFRTRVAIGLRSLAAAALRVALRVALRLFCGRRPPGRARLAAPVFAETFRATAVSIDARTHDVYDITIWHDRKRNAERLDDHTTNTSYLFSYAKGMLYTTRRNRCTATRVSPTMAAPRMPRESPLLASDLEDVNGMDGVEHWSNPGGRSPDWEEVWVMRKGRTCEPVRERYRRHASAAAQQTAPLRAADDESKGDGASSTGGEYDEEPWNRLR